MSMDRWAMIPPSRLAAPALMVSCLLAAAEPQVQTKTTDWCRITAPKTAKVGERVRLRVERIGLDGDLFVSCDLKDQSHKMVKWGGRPRPLAKGKEVVYDLVVRDQPGIESVYGFVAVTRRPEDKWDQAVATTATPLVSIVGRSPLVDLQHNKSWIYVDASNGGQPLTSGDRWRVPVDYHLDPSEHFGVTTLYIWGTGPWIDTPDGKYAKKRGHIGYRGLGGRVKLTKPGRGRYVFTFTVPPGLDMVRENNRVLLIAGFTDATGQKWPWYVRANNSFVRKRGFFEIETDVPGNLFTYDEPVRVSIRPKTNVARAGQAHTLRYTVHDTTGAVAAKGEKPFVAERDGRRVHVDLELARRGAFLIELDVPGWETRRTTFARIPDLLAITRGEPTRFGMTTHWSAPREEVWAIAQRLGLSWCRRFTRWYRLQPGPDVYKLDALADELDTARRYGVQEWLCLVDAPAFAFPGKVTRVSYRAFDCNWDAWREFVHTTTTRLKGKLYGWEWLNEITPGGCDDPVATYVKMCRIGTETAKAIDPKIVTILAGGLYPRTFRLDVLRAGVGRYIDALPVHYQNGDGIAEARQDLDAADCRHVAVWEDESAKGVNAWGVPPLEELRSTVQSDWVLMQWTDELAAGCERIIYFGGPGSAAGSFGYLLDDLSPRPVAATLAVLTSKLHRAKPVGVFLLGRGGLLHLFERDSKPILVASTYEAQGERVPLQVGADSVVLTDYQGNESIVAAPGGEAMLPLGRTRCFVEGADLDVLKAYAAARLDTTRVAAGTSSSVARARRTTPRVSMLMGRAGALAVRVHNHHARPLSGSLRVAVPEGWPTPDAVRFSVDPGRERAHRLAVAVPDGVEARDYPVTVELRFEWDKLPRVDKPVVLSIISPDMLGNLMPNPGLEIADATGRGPKGWRVNGRTKRWAKADGLGDGLGKWVLKFQNATNWEHCGQTIPVRGGQTYLYTAWVRNQGMGCGSNMTQYLSDGRQIRLYDVQVFRCGPTNPHWKVFTCRKAMPPDTERASFTPVARGSGWALYDNVRVTLFEGSDYAAEAHRAATPPKIDGRLDDWTKTCPIPLIGSNQITSQADGYGWTPANLSAVGYLMWDDANLYVAFQVRDDRHHPTGSGQQVGRAFIEGDSLVLGIDPTQRGQDAAARASAYYFASTVPGGGSGKHTLFRPADHNGGRPSGHLFRDSSIYDMAVAVGPGTCVYELRAPLSELGVDSATGTKIGLAVQLNDNDGRGRVAQMNWGEGLWPSWRPSEFGIVTFVE